MRMLHVVPSTSNRKLGYGTAATHRPVGITCPNSCSLLENGCYAKRGPETFVQAKSAQKSDDLDKAKGVPFIRHLASGDFLKTNKRGAKIVDRKLLKHVFSWHRENPDTTGWGYTHAPEQIQKAGFGPDQMPENLHVLASCHTPDEAAKLQGKGWRTARVAENEGLEPGEAYCPYDLHKRRKINNAGTTCMSCRLCFANPVNIVFLKS